VGVVSPTDLLLVFVGILCLGILGITSILTGRIVRRHQQQIEDDPLVQTGISSGPNPAAGQFTTLLTLGGVGLLLLFLCGVVQMVSWVVKGLVAW
jgi:hypothetical protein